MMATSINDDTAWTIVTAPRKTMIETEPPNGLIIIRIPQTREMNAINLEKNAVGPVKAEDIVEEASDVMTNQIPSTTEKMPVTFSLKAKSRPTAIRIAATTVVPMNV